MKSHFLSSVAVFFILLAAACVEPPPPPTKTTVNPIPVAGPTEIFPTLPLWKDEDGVYITGASSFAKIWGKSVVQPLNSGFLTSWANDIYLSGNGIYMIGSATNWESDCVFPPCSYSAVLWKDGISQQLELHPNEWDSQASSIVVSKDIVYVAGGLTTHSNYRVAALWVDGILHKLSSEYGYASANDIFVSNDTVYVAGYIEQADGPKSTLWKNGVAETLSGGSSANSVFVYEGDVYVAGDGIQSIVWKNGVAQELESPSKVTVARSIVVVNGDVYVTGYESDPEALQGYGSMQAVVWKNGISHTLYNENYNSEVNAISVVGEDVYLAGYIGSQAVVWKNGIAHSLGLGVATGIAIQK